MTKRESRIPLWRDDRFWRIAVQALAVLAIAIIVLLLWDNLSSNMQRLGVKFGFDFLRSQSSFDIGETSISYQPSDPYTQALFVGLVNSLKIMVAGIILTTIVGITAGIWRLSDNWLVRNLALAYVELFRNTPLLVQLFFWYFAVFISLISDRKLSRFPGSVYLTNQGLSIPWLSANYATSLWLVILAIGFLIAILLWRWRSKLMLERGIIGRQLPIALGAIAVAGTIAFIFTRSLPLMIDLPTIKDDQVQGGLRLSIEFSALLLGLTFYTGAFIAEIVRAGIQSVPKGQWEAARSLGMKPGLVMRLVVFPQALRVIIPPLTSQYLNLAKNSSLAFAIGYPDIYSVSNTIFNNTGRAVEVTLLIMLVYLTISLLISQMMNLLNQTVQFKQR